MVQIQMVERVNKQISPQEYLEAEVKSDLRHDISITGSKPNHNLIVLNLAATLILPCGASPIVRLQPINPCGFPIDRFIRILM